MTNALANKQGQLNPLKDVDPRDILDRYLKEETSTQIAASYGVTKSALSFFMLKHAEEQWKEAQVIKALTRKENAERQLEEADNALDLARGRELLRAAQWDLERVCRRIYGQDAPAQLAQVVINVQNMRESVVHAQQSGEVADISISHVDESKT
jgi:ribosome biogenesis GTPase A